MIRLLMTVQSAGIGILWAMGVLDMLIHRLVDWIVGRE